MEEGEENIIYYSVKQTAEKLGIKPGQVLRLIKRGKLGYIKPGWNYLITHKNVEEFLENSKR